MSFDFFNRGPLTGGRAALRTRTSVAAGALLLAGSLVGWTAGSAGIGNITAAGKAAAASAAPAVSALPNGAPASYASVVDQVAPAVVTIRSERRVKVSQDLPDDPLFRQFFGDQFGFGGRRQLPDRREGALGSGVIVRGDGYILTNHHVVDAAEQVTVDMTDGRSFKAKVVGSDKPSDLAVLKIDGRDLPTLTLGDSDAVRVGDVVLAVGNPLNVGQTVTMGIVSAKGRATDFGDGAFEDFIQTDAPINQGNSGGALVSTRGELVGINSQILTPSGGNIGIGFAIPANMARNVMTQLVEHGQVRRGRMGVTIQPVTSEIARSLGLEHVRGALVNSVQAGGPAEKAGIRRGDVITAVNGHAVKDNNELRNEVASQQPGSRVQLTVVRDGKEQNVSVTLAELQERAESEDRGESRPDSSGFGMSVEPLTPETARQLGVRASSGVVVTDVRAGSRAADAGLRAGDVIVEVDRRPVQSVDGLQSALKQGDRPALLLVQRAEATMFLTIDRG